MQGAKLIQKPEEGRQQDAINEDGNQSRDEAGGVGTNSDQADGFPCEIWNEDVENPRNNGKSNGMAAWPERGIRTRRVE